MKKQILTALITIGATASIMAQGYVNFSTRVTGTVVGHVYGPGDATQLSGNTAAETPAGTQVYAGSVLTGSGYSATLWAANGVVTDVGALALVPSSLTSFRTGATLGGTPAVLPPIQIPGVAAGGTGTFQIRAWDNEGGLITSFDTANTRGASALFQVSGLGDGTLTLPADLAGFRSFNIFSGTVVPEPATFVLAGLGAASLLIFRRRK
jgi:hypothetical protein